MSGTRRTTTFFCSQHKHTPSVGGWELNPASVFVLFVVPWCRDMAIVNALGQVTPYTLAAGLALGVTAPDSQQVERLFSFVSNDLDVSTYETEQPGRNDTQGRDAAANPFISLLPEALRPAVKPWP